MQQIFCSAEMAVKNKKNMHLHFIFIFFFTPTAPFLADLWSLFCSLSACRTSIQSKIRRRCFQNHDDRELKLKEIQFLIKVVAFREYTVLLVHNSLTKLQIDVLLQSWQQNSIQCQLFNADYLTLRRKSSMMSQTNVHQRNDSNKHFFKNLIQATR